MGSSFKRNLWIVGIIVAAVLLIDQVVKIWVKTSFTEQLPDGSVMYAYGREVKLVGDWFKLIYIENQGMAFGTTFGSTMWGKLGLSVFRILAIIGIGYYWYKQARKGAKTELLIAVGFIFAGATGNLIDSMFYDFIFPYDPCLSFNHLEGSGNWVDCGFGGRKETRHTGFLFGNVVDMFQFNMTWPAWMPWVGGNEVFPAIWNIADGSITIGVVMMILRQRVFFAGKHSAEQDARELLGLRQIGLLGGSLALLLIVLLSLKIIAVPAGYETMAFYGFVVLYLFSFYVTSRMCMLQNRNSLAWIALTVILPFPTIIVLSRLQSKAAVI